MPITPLHFGPAIAGNALASKHFSVLAFCHTQVIIDAEAGFYLVQGAWPLHPFLHSYLGVTVVAVVTVLLGRPLLGPVIRGWNRLLPGRCPKPAAVGMRRCCPLTGLTRRVLFSALTGGDGDLSHIPPESAQAGGVCGTPTP